MAGIVKDIPNLASIKLRDCTYRVDFSEAHTKKKLTIMLPGAVGLVPLCEVPVMSRNDIIKILVRINAYTKARDEMREVIKHGAKVVTPMEGWPGVGKELLAPKKSLWSTIEDKMEEGIVDTQPRKKRK